MKIFKILWLLFPLVLSCQPQEGAKAYKKTFPRIEQLSVDSIVFDEVIKLGDIYKTENYIILRNVHEQADFFFYVYSYPSIEYLYSFAQRGSGLNEYLMPTAEKKYVWRPFCIP